MLCPDIPSSHTSFIRGTLGAAMAAPFALFDDEWHDFKEFEPVSEQGTRMDRVNLVAEQLTGVLRVLPELNNSLSGEIGSFKSMEDLVTDFDEKLAVCFRNVNTQTENIAPVNIIAEDTTLRNDEIWDALADNYGNVMAVDWKESRTRSLHLPNLILKDEPRVDDVTLELSDDELREQMDMHTIIVSCLNDEPLFTAEQVMEEIEEMMQDSPDLGAEQNHPSQSDLSMLSLDIQRPRTNHSYEEREMTLCGAELNERLEEVEMAIRHYSEELIQHLALRDELDFEKEVKNSFISILIDVQNRQKEHRELRKKKKNLKSGAGAPQGRPERTQALGSRFSMVGLSSAIQNGFRQTFGSGGSERQYLTTVIPYEKKGGPPSVEDLQILTQILQAMRDDSDKVPRLLTDYILKVLCPT
ncbi:fasciculation and elongation protein zeta-2-like isoform X23 [Oncorhynchus keta]|uniref:fasciculation and elongation protein zeta-2-like isoform X21 n=1 Tax=Oncorhynchus keta TaxID=8018 RepID=UPI0015F8C357|nr:fasciculation and elongation protein zeta-2-like isoform X21 [Oncorhynchus keta]XP_052350012.1 fasciculation and elongation protein zeta-2-like isoform X22 [Oncorhynchus keta]XP_052350014.1 fasciculation and elongation protein zeta-2-like isoform X23 [Oncorhynchus keta]